VHRVHAFLSEYSLIIVRISTKVCEDFYDTLDGETISIAAQVPQHRTFDDGNTQVQLQDTEGQEFLLKIWDGDLPAFEFREDEWILLEDALGDIYNGNVNVGSNYGDIQVTSLESPPSSVDQDEPDNTAADSTQQSGGVVALDIETISTVPEAEFEFENSDHLELLCIGVGYAPYQGAPGASHTLFRSGTTGVSEAALLQQFCGDVEGYGIFVAGDMDVVFQDVKPVKYRFFEFAGCDLSHLSEDFLEG